MTSIKKWIPVWLYGKWVIGCCYTSTLTWSCCPGWKQHVETIRRRLTFAQTLFQNRRQIPSQPENARHTRWQHFGWTIQLRVTWTPRITMLLGCLCDITWGVSVSISMRNLEMTHPVSLQCGLTYSWLTHVCISVLEKTQRYRACKTHFTF